jgi:metal-responsive CopG/Arc/MetJ family transcriptional regulator
MHRSGCVFFVVWGMMWSKLHSMETIQIVLDKQLLHATDRAARQTNRNRSALVRDALREHLRSLEIRAREERDRKGYSMGPERHHESTLWEGEATWPPE